MGKNSVLAGDCSLLCYLELYTGTELLFDHTVRNLRVCSHA